MGRWYPASVRPTTTTSTHEGHMGPRHRTTGLLLALAACTLAAAAPPAQAAEHRTPTQAEAAAAPPTARTITMHEYDDHSGLQTILQTLRTEPLQVGLLVTLHDVYTEHARAEYGDSSVVLAEFTVETNDGLLRRVLVAHEPVLPDPLSATDSTLVLQLVPDHVPVLYERERTRRTAVQFLRWRPVGEQWPSGRTSTG